MNRSRVIGITLMVVAMATAILLLTACVRPQSEVQAAEPQPSNVIAVYELKDPSGWNQQWVWEFRDSAGRICVMIRRGGQGIALDCGYPRDYNGGPES